MKPFRSTFAPPRSAAECLRLWATVTFRAIEAGNRQDIDFTDRIMLQAHRPGWEPTPMQMDLMRKLVDRYCPSGMGLDLDLIPGAEIGWTTEPVAETQACERCNADGATLHVASGRVLCTTCATSNRGRV